jgi:hypothetical protein
LSKARKKSKKAVFSQIRGKELGRFWLNLGTILKNQLLEKSGGSEPQAIGFSKK